MKIRINFPDGGIFDYESEKRSPISDERFTAICLIIGGAMILLFFAFLFKR